MFKLLKPNNRSEEYKKTLLSTDEMIYNLYADMKKLYGEESDEVKAVHDCWRIITAYEIGALDLIIENIV